MTNMWTAELPTEKGRYWYYGRRFTEDKELFMVICWGLCNSSSGKKRPVFVQGNSFLYPKPGALWQPVIIPDLPAEE